MYCLPFFIFKLHFLLYLQCKCLFYLMTFCVDSSKFTRYIFLALLPKVFHMLHTLIDNIPMHIGRTQLLLPPTLNAAMSPAKVTELVYWFRNNPWPPLETLKGQLGKGGQSYVKESFQKVFILYVRQMGFYNIKFLSLISISKIKWTDTLPCYPHWCRNNPWPPLETPEVQTGSSFRAPQW